MDSVAAKLGLSEATLEKLIGFIGSIAGIDQAIVYGSRAKGNYRPGSDIDLTLKGLTLSLDEVYQLDQLLYDSNIPYLFDISVYHTLKSEELTDHIDRRGVLIYDRNASAGMNRV